MLTTKKHIRVIIFSHRNKIDCLHGENSRDIISRNITVILYLGDFEARSHAPLSRDMFFFRIQLVVSRRQMYEMIWNF